MKPGGPFEHAGPRWFTIPAHRSFVGDLARVLHDTLVPMGPEAISDAILLTPTRRGARALADAFVGAAGGGAVLLPQIRAVGDLDEGEPPFEPGALALELPPAISPLRRRFELARLIVERAPPEGRALDAAGALELADALAGFLDSLQIEEVVDPDRIERLVEGDLARHWKRSAEFLAVATRLWPRRLEELGLIDPTERRVRLLRLLRDQWDRDPPKGPLIAAGSTGTAPATADLLDVVARAPLGCVVLPGLDLQLADDAWEQVDEQHPQGAMKRLLDRHKLTRADVREWPAAESASERTRGRWRRRVINEALRPAAATADWRRQIEDLQKEGGADGLDPIREGLNGLSLVSARTEEEAAAVAAVLLREALETPNLTAALVTPDQALARRVAARLSRWGVDADSSAGGTLAGFPVGVLVGLVAAAAEDPTRPATLLGLLKHPFVRLGREPRDLDRAAEALEAQALRGRRAKSWTELQTRLSRIVAEARAAEPPREWLAEQAELAAGLARDLETALAPFIAVFADGPTSAPDAGRACVEAVEALARRPEGGLGGLWGGGAGEAAASLLADLMRDGGALPAVDEADFHALLDALFSAETVRTGGASHPRLRILGAIEARLVRADRLILAGLEEGVWPKGAPIDPFLSRPMRQSLGLPPPERRIGLSAHDFAQAACAPEVVLLHTERLGGQPAVPSRWLWRLETLARGAKQHVARRDDALAWARALDAPKSQTPAYARRPEPRPPVEVRPRSLYVTRVEKWVRDPYAIYAQFILGLKAMDRPDLSAEVLARGRAVHKALELLVERHPGEVPEDAEAIVEQLLLEALADEGFEGAAMARERPLAENAARFIADFERRRRVDGLQIFVERSGAHAFEAPGGVFTVKAKADRIEVRGRTGAVLDFKTGRAPTTDEIAAGFAPQLSLTAAILAAGGFKEAGKADPSSLTYVRVTGRRNPGEPLERAGGDEAATLAQEALDGLKRRVARFDDPSTPYVSWAAPQFMGDFGGDYDHLARVWEWAVIGADEGGDGGAE